MTAEHTPSDPARRQRRLEGWLPLAQEANLRYGWGLDGPALEALIDAAAPGLGRARSALEAAAALWGAHARAVQGEPRQ